ncbi:MAG: protein arginine kinase [Firmicutes bacterium]|nr:protein arginine kinase [Bacillota bacterium]
MNLTWYDDPKADDSPIISARVRLARNIKKYPFRSKLTSDQATDMISEANNALFAGAKKWLHKFSMITHDFRGNINNATFAEKHIISREFMKDNLPRGLILQDDGNLSIMLNEEDHIRIQTVSPADNINASWQIANNMDNLLEEKLDFAFDKDYGYLTACPTNVGTGMRASFMVHLPLLVKTGQLKNLLSAISKFGIAIRGIYGEGSESMGGIFQISNQITLGKSEQDIIQALQSVTRNVIDKELWLRKKMLEKHELDISNNIHRAYGILRYSRRISLKEAMDMLSELRLGYSMGILDLPKPRLTIYRIMTEVHPGHILQMFDPKLTETEQDEARAEYLRYLFGEEQHEEESDDFDM